MSLPKEIKKENFTIEVTTRCNSSCSHCFATAGRSHISEFDRREALLLTEEAFHMGYRHLHITGGEPLLWPYIIPLCDYALSLGYETIFLNTNGHYLSEDMAQKLKTLGSALGISVSIQGPPFVHDAIRGKGSHALAEAGLHHALEAGLQVEIFTSVGKTLLPLIPRYANDLFKTYSGITNLTLIQLIRVPRDFFNLSTELLSPENFLQLVKATSLIALRGYPISILENPLATVVARSLNMEWFPLAQPLYRKGRLTVLADRSVTLAHSTRHALGHYKGGSLSSLLTSPLYEARLNERKNICEQCRHLKVCRRWGMVRPSEWFRDEVDIPYCQRVLSLLAEEISQRA